MFILRFYLESGTRFLISVFTPFILWVVSDVEPALFSWLVVPADKLVSWLSFLDGHSNTTFLVQIFITWFIIATLFSAFVVSRSRSRR